MGLIRWKPVDDDGTSPGNDANSDGDGDGDCDAGGEGDDIVDGDGECDDTNTSKCHRTVTPEVMS